MIWQSPAALWLLLAVPVLVALFFYRKRYPVVIVPSLGPWSVIGTPIRSSNWRNLLRRLLVLLLQLLIVLALIIAAGRPRRPDTTYSSVVVVLDLSATMHTRTATGETRFELARRIARDVIASAGARPVSLIMASDIPLLPQDAAGASSLISLVDHAQPAMVDSQLAEAIKLAGSMAGQDASATVEVISDFAGASPGRLVAAWSSPAQLRLRQVGENAPDVGLAFAAYDADARLVRGQLLQQQSNGVSVRVAASADGQLLGSVMVSLSDRQADFELKLEDAARPPDTVIELALDHADAFELNNRMLLRTDFVKRKVVVIGEPTSGLLPLLAAADNVEITQMSPGQPTDLAAVDLVVVDRAALPDGAPPARAYLFVGCVDGVGWMQADGEVASEAPTSWSPTHPMLDDIFPDALKVSRAIRASPGPGAHGWSIVESGDVQLVSEIRVGRTTRAIYLLFDPFTSPAGSSLAFPLMILNALDYLAPGGKGTRAFFETGEAAEVAPADAYVDVTAPDGTPVAVVASGGMWRIAHLNQVGLYRVTAGEDRFAFPVNYASTRWSMPLPSVAASAEGAHRDYFAWLGQLPLTVMVLAAAMALCLVETALSGRGWIRI